MKCIAHISEDGKRIQTVKEHSENVAKLCSDFSIDELKDISYNIGLLHDIGKYQKSFQKRISGENIKIEHSICGAKDSMDEFDNNKIIELMAYVIAGHHSGIPDYGTKIDTENDGTLSGRLKRTTEDYNEYKNELALKSIDIDSILNKFELKQENISNGYDKLSFMCRYLYSCLVDADTIDTVKFCKNIKYETLKSNFYECLEKVNKKLESFTCETELQKVRTKIQKQAFDRVDKKSNIYVLNMPTGSGKTLCSIKFALERAIKTNKKHIIYVIPYNSIIDQTAELFQEVFGNSANILRHQSTYIYEDERDEDYKTIINRAEENWDANIVITTMVQFFESMYSNKRSMLRKLHNMTDSIIVFDEAHLISLNILQPCLSSISILSKYFNSEIILLSATMPDYQKMMNEFANFNTRFFDLIDDTKDFKIFETSKYKYIGDVEKENIVDEIQNYKSSLVVLNKRKNVEELYKMSSGNKYYLTTYLIPKHRKEIIKRIRIQLSELESDYIEDCIVPIEKRVRVFSTSLIEAGVDLDFHTIFRELNGLDNIIQSAGRCNREGKLKTAEVKIFKLSDTYSKSVDSIKLKITEELIKDCGSFDVELIKEYYNRLYFLDKNKNLIMSKSLLKYCENNHKEPFPFMSYANDFNVIDNMQISLIIPIDEECKKIIEEIEFVGSIDINKLRILYNYTINLYKNEFEELLKQKVVCDLPNGMYYLKNLDYYDIETGVKFQGKDYFI